MAQRAPRRDLTGKRQRHAHPAALRAELGGVVEAVNKGPHLDLMRDACYILPEGAFLRFLFYGYVSMLTLWMVMASVGFWFSSTAV